MMFYIHVWSTRRERCTQRYRHTQFIYVCKHTIYICTNVTHHGVDGPAEDEGGEEAQRDDVAQRAGDEVGRGAVES